MIIPPTWNLPEAIQARLGQNTFGRQRTIAEAGHLLIILHKPPAADDTRREGVLFWRDAAGDWKWSRGAGGGQALTAHVQAYADLDAALAERFEKARDTSSLHELLGAATPLARAAANMHAALQDAREATRGETARGEKLLIELRDRAYETDRNLNLLLEDIRHAIQYRSVREAEEQNRLTREALRASHRLNILAALFLPLTAIASLFGMNIAHGLDQQSVASFWIVSIVSIAFGFAIKSWVLAREPASPSSTKASSDSKIKK